MRRIRAASRSAHLRRDLVQSHMRGFLAISARPRRARRGRRRVRGVRGTTLCVVHGDEYHIQRPETLFAVMTHCVIMVREMSRTHRPDGTQPSSSTRKNDVWCLKTADQRARAYPFETPLTFLLRFRRAFRRRGRSTARGRTHRS